MVGKILAAPSMGKHGGQSAVWEVEQKKIIANINYVRQGPSRYN